jgi:ATP-dependent Clp protease ATP-binding subunit ClpB
MIAREGFDPVYGARPLKRFLQRQLETRIGRAIIAGEVLPGSTVKVGVQGGEIHLEVEKPEPVAAQV